MSGYEFIGIAGLSEMFNDHNIAVWISEHMIFIGIIIGIGTIIAKWTPGKADDEVWAWLKEKFNSKEVK